MRNAEVAEQADAHDSNSCSFGSVGSIPTFGTYLKFAWIISRALPRFGRVFICNFGKDFGFRNPSLEYPVGSWGVDP